MSRICQECDSDRVMCATTTCLDGCVIEYAGGLQKGEVPKWLNIGDGRYVDFIYCLECGQIQGDWPVNDPPPAQWNPSESDEVIEITMEKGQLETIMKNVP